MFGDFGEQRFRSGAGTNFNADMLGRFQNFSLEKQVVNEGYDLGHAVNLIFRCIMRGGGQQAALVAGLFFNTDTLVGHVAGAALYAVVDAEKAGGAQGFVVVGGHSQRTA